MAVKYKDYYKILGVDRHASAEDLKKAFRNLAKKHHPDRTKGDKKSEERFKEINEAYEVLSDPDKKKRYDTLGTNWQQGQDFTPPSDWESIFTGHAGQRRGGGGQSYSFEGGDISDFFDLFRGGNRHSKARGSSGGGFEDLFSGMGAAAPHGAYEPQPSDAEGDMDITLEEAYRGGVKKVTMARMGGERHTYDIKIPAGIRDGQKIRLKGEGNKVGGRSGDLLIRVHISPHSTYAFDGKDLVEELKVSPWEAALGAKISVPTLDGPVDMKLPAGVRSGQRLRLAERGYPLGSNKGRGDLFVKLMIVVPKTLTAQEKELFEKLQHVSRFDPRA